MQWRSATRTKASLVEPQHTNHTHQKEGIERTIDTISPEELADDLDAADMAPIADWSVITRTRKSRGCVWASYG
jgi:hypothetical protein